MFGSHPPPPLVLVGDSLKVTPCNAGWSGMCYETHRTQAGLKLAAIHLRSERAGVKGMRYHTQYRARLQDPDSGPNLWATNTLLNEFSLHAHFTLQKLLRTSMNNLFICRDLL